MVMCLVVIICSCSKQPILTLKPVGLAAKSFVFVEAGQLKATFVDNSAFGEFHRAGYNGIAELFHQQQDSSIFVPFYAGFNLEHIFGGDSLGEIFEPRKAPMFLYQDENKILIYQPATPASSVENLTKFEIVAPHYIDVEFRCIIHSKNFFPHNYAGLFWASYINAPSNKHIYFWGQDKNQEGKSWIAAYSSKHGFKSCHRWKNDNADYYFAPNFNLTLVNNFSDYKYDLPVYFGKYHNMAFAYFFDQSDGIRFSQSPTGGGATNPAWDFQYIIPNLKVGKEYSFKARLVYKPFISNEDILKEYSDWEYAVN